MSTPLVNFNPALTGWNLNYNVSLQNVPSLFVFTAIHSMALIRQGRNLLTNVVWLIVVLERPGRGKGTGVHRAVPWRN